jgi:organic hydroperoxide reductase OsmC/OhrA
MSTSHEYRAQLSWEGNLGTGTARYDGYARTWRVRMAGKTDLLGTADPAFRGDTDKYNPEDLLVASLGACHMLTYLALCAKYKISVLSYRDEATGVMKTTPDGGGAFESVTLHPAVEIADAAMHDKAVELHEKAHALCFIARSVNFPVLHEATVNPKP